jgi:hypothetical protein
MSRPVSLHSRRRNPGSRKALPRSVGLSPVANPRTSRTPVDISLAAQ